MIGFASGSVKNQLRVLLSPSKQGTKPVLRGSDFVDLKGIGNKLLGMKYSLPPPVKTENSCNNKGYIRASFFFQLNKPLNCLLLWEDRTCTLGYKVEAGNSRSEFCMTLMVFLSSYWTAGNVLAIVEISLLNT